MSNTARTNNKRAELQTEESRAEERRMEEHAADTRPRVSSIDEDEEYIPPRANYPLVRVIEQGRYETMAMLRNGEQLMLNIIFPVMALIALRFTGLIDEYANSVGVIPHGCGGPRRSGALRDFYGAVRSGHCHRF